MNEDLRSRKWQVTLNNPVEHNQSHDFLKEVLAQFKGCVYWVLSDEIGEQGTYHTHIYFVCANAVKFSVVHNRFPGAHLEIANGTSAENRDYIFKLGKWSKSKKAETNLEDTHEEFGEVPLERQGARNDIADLYDSIKDGLSDYEIIEANPSYMGKLEQIEKVRQILNYNRFKSVFRSLEVTYLYGTPGSGKTRSVMEKYGYENVFRVTDYVHPFDSYRSQDVVIFEEFRSSLKIQDMLNYLDGYPVELPCRYNNKIACFTKVFIISNLDFNQQYAEIQHQFPTTWKAFCRRIGLIIPFKDEHSLDVQLSFS